MIMRYQPKDVNEWVVMNFKKLLMARRATIKAVIKPVKTNSHSLDEKLKPVLTKS